MSKQKTNMLFFLTDQHRKDTLGCYGNETVTTPTIDGFAAEGVAFDRFYTPTAICTPARASLLTGAAPFRHQLLANYERNVGYREELADDQYTFSEDLRDNGYNVGLVGKWHVGTNKTGADYGFDGIHMEGWHNPIDHPEYLKYLKDHNLPEYAISDPIRGTFPNGTPGNLLAARLEQPVEATFEYFLAERAISMLRDYASGFHAEQKPFFLATHFFGPHLPYVIPAKYFDMYDSDGIELPKSVMETFDSKPHVQKNYSAHWTFDTLPTNVSKKLIAAYWGYVTLIDEQIGRVVEVARELGVYDDSAVFFSADHGEFTGSHRLHDKGPAMYEDIYNIPGIVKVPGVVKGVKSSKFATLLDFTATVLDLAGLDASKAVDGRSVREIALGHDVEWREDLITEFHGHHFPYPQRMLVNQRYKLIVNPESINELYDLVEDPDELHNQYFLPEKETVRNGLLQRMYVLLRDRGDNFYHWMTSMYPVGGKDYDAALSSFE